MLIPKISLIAVLALAPAALSTISGRAFADETPSALLEKGIFQQETAGDLDAAEKIYKQIVDEAAAQRHAVAEAQYRLGVCYQKQGKKEEAQAAFREVVAKYPDQTELVARAQKELGVAAPGQAAYQPLELNPAPWPDDELMVMKIRSKADVELGAMFYTAKRLDWRGEPIGTTVPPTTFSGTGPSQRGTWRIESYQVIPINDWREYTIVDADALTFVPTASRTVNGLGDFRAFYEPGKISLNASQEGSTTVPQSGEVLGTVYDNEQVIYLLRRLPLKEGYAARFQILPVMGGALVECHIRVDGREDMADLANNRIPCWKVILSVSSQGAETLQHQLWIEAEGEHRVVKYDSGSAVMQLVPWSYWVNLYPSPKLAGENCPIPDGDGFSIKRVPDWYGYFDHPKPEYKFSLQLLPPELKAWAVFVGKERPAGMDARQIAEGDANILKGLFKNYAVRADGWSNVTISSLKGTSFIADYQEKDRAMVEYRTYVVTEIPSSVFWFVFRVEKDQFDAMRPQFDKVVQSLKAPEWMSSPDAEYLTLCAKAFLVVLPAELRVRDLAWAPQLREPQSGKILQWGINPLRFSADEQQQRKILPEGIRAIQNATIFPEKVRFVASAGIGSDPPLHLFVTVIGREEAERRRAAAHQEPK